MNVRFSRRALRDLEEIAGHIAVDNPLAALRVRAAIQRAIALVAGHPYAGIRNARNPDLRSRLATPFPYRIHYRVRGETLWILHLRHTARRGWHG